MKTRTLSRLLIPVLLLLALTGPARADGLDTKAVSLTWTPANVSSYTAWLRSGEQWQAVSDSKAWAKLCSLPVVQDALQKIQAPDSPFKVLQEKQVKELLGIAGEMMARECCILSGEHFADFIVLMQKIQAANQLAPLLGALGGQQDQNLARLQAILRALNEHRDKLQFPDTLLGFRLENAARAGAVRKRLDGGLGDLVEAVPAFKGRLKKMTLADSDWTTVTLDGSMVPWDDIPWQNLESEAGEFKMLVQKLKEIKVTFALGTRGDFLVFTLGSPAALVRSLGGDNRLIDRPELKPLAKFADRKLSSISYTSKALATTLATKKEDVEGMVALVEMGLDRLPLTKDERQKIVKDLKELAKEMTAALPQAGASLGFSFSTERAFESYQYDWTLPAGGRGSGAAEPKPLTILQHVGGDPLIVYASHSSSRNDAYKTLVKWVKLVDGYIDDLALPKLEEEQRKQARMVLEIVRPALKALDTITQQRLLPALKDGQEAFVLDARLESKQWFAFLGQSDKALPLPEPVFVLGVSDAEQLMKALHEYRVAVNRLLKGAEAFSGKELQIPPAKERKVKDGVVYWYAFGELLGLDEQLRLSAAIGSKAAAFGLSTETTERMLKPTPFKGGGPLARAERPLLSAGSVNGAGIIKALTPWVDLTAERLLDLWVDEKEKRDSIRKQVATVLEVLAVFRSSASATYVEDKARVTHTETIVRDVEK